MAWWIKVFPVKSDNLDLKGRTNSHNVLWRWQTHWYSHAHTHSIQTREGTRREGGERLKGDGGQRERQGEREKVLFLMLRLFPCSSDKLSSFRKHLERNSLALVQSSEDRPSKLKEQANPTPPFHSIQPFLSIRHPGNSFTLPHFSFATYYHSIMVT